MRTKNSLKNIVFGLTGQIVSVFMGFFVRTAFVYSLGVEYLGIDGLFTNILTMLSLTNLGFDTAIIYSLYRPLAEKDELKIQAYVNLYRKAYKLIGFLVLIIGLMLLPFLRHFINGDTNINNVNIIYLVFLMNSVFSYFITYKQSVIIADQRNHIISKYHSFFTITSNLIQIIVLLVMKEYLFVISMQVIFRLLENIYIRGIANKYYPFLKRKNNSKLSSRDVRNFSINLYSVFLYKISAVVINGTDNIVISKFLGISYVGLYANYLLIISTIDTFISYIFHSITASVGNLSISESQEKKFLVFRVIFFVNFLVYGVCSVVLWTIMNPFITFWLGENYTFNNFTLFVILLNFYTSGMQGAATTFRETTGLFRKGKYRPIIAAILNIFFSIVLTIKIGMPGVFLGTVISRLLTYFWYDPMIVYKELFGKSVYPYHVRYIFYFILVLVCSLITSYAKVIILFHHTLLGLILMTGISLLIPTIIFILIFKQTVEYKYLLQIMTPISIILKNKLRVTKKSMVG